eukprot:8946637-Alexandrium_andersonii.AAC.1
MGHVKACVVQAGVDMQVRNAERRRKTFGGVHSVPVHLTTAVCKGMDDADRRILMRVFSGAAWRPQVLSRIDESIPSVRRMCGGGGDLRHLLWQCPVTRCARQKFGLDAVCVC